MYVALKQKLRETLDKRALSHVKIVAADGEWFISRDILKDAQLAKAIDSIG